MLRLRTWLAAQDGFPAPLFLQASRLPPPDTNVYSHPHSFLDLLCFSWSVCAWSHLVFVILWSLAYFLHLWWTLEEAPEVCGSLPLGLTTYEPVLPPVPYILVNNILAQAFWRKELFIHDFNPCASFRARDKINTPRSGSLDCFWWWG